MAKLRLEFQTRVLLVLIAVIVPTFVIMTLVQNQVTKPILETEMKHIGIATAEALGSKIVTNRWLARPESYPQIEGEIQEQLYLQPSVFRIDVFAKDSQLNQWRVVASNIEGETGTVISNLPLTDHPTSVYRTEDGLSFWEINVPVDLDGPRGRGPKRVVAYVRLYVSTKTVQYLTETFWRVSVVAAGISTILLVLILTYFLRRAILNERLLRRVESENVQLSEQLHETQRELMNQEKLAVMGQLTANFAHEIGTPLNAISGHLQLMDGELSRSELPQRTKERLGILRGEVLRIETIVKGFLQTTSKPESQKQWVDINSLVDRVMDLVRPRLDTLKVRVKLKLDRKLGPVNVVPTDVEQVLINLLNNSLDSLALKSTTPNQKPVLEISLTTQSIRRNGREWALVSVKDSGMGIKKEHLWDVAKPFFTTKKPGQGTGLGLSICREIASRYGGLLEIDSKEGNWAEVVLKIPFAEGA